MTDSTADPTSGAAARVWRVGGVDGHAIFAQLGAEPSDGDEFLGVMRSWSLALHVVLTHNASRYEHCPDEAEPAGPGLHTVLPVDEFAALLDHLKVGHRWRWRIEVWQEPGEPPEAVAGLLWTLTPPQPDGRVIDVWISGYPVEAHQAFDEVVGRVRRTRLGLFGGATAGPTVRVFEADVDRP